jgi:hypothetical protein
MAGHSGWGRAVGAPVVRVLTVVARSEATQGSATSVTVAPRDRVAPLAGTIAVPRLGRPPRDVGERDRRRTGPAEKSLPGETGK